ncbi:MAG: hypothetical protein KJ670_13325 [Alphaproteobacteria bacterium]|nr:hypothetical protein [Rhizobiaceae bacterium]MBU3959346.1 hypothetical protein [Alphaproteobacteria bacterium]MBU4049513.1 hypothetical protein [Alphaproteobacteria bacterium]MBU4089690.1 hypothetical protein [Alphaproteobacteria bacterium]MBU4154820.1 hypothetical protein [Alphaproteobacteria bacterium]
MQFVDELKRKRGEVSGRIDALRSEIAALEEQRAAFDIIIKVYDPGYRVEAAVQARVRKPSKVSTSSVTPLLKGIDKRGSLLRMLREADGPISTGECARRMAGQIGLAADDPRLGQLGNVLSRDLDKLVKNGRVRYAPVGDGGRRLWEIAA